MSDALQNSTPQHTETTPKSDLQDRKISGEPPPDLVALYCSSLYRKCSNCGRTGHNSRTCLESRNAATSQGKASQEEKSTPTENTENKDDEDASDDSDSKQKGKNGSKKKGKPWNEEEHRLFLKGLEVCGKGNWRSISRQFVPHRNPTQVASHAQKYFMRKAAGPKRKRRASVFDIGHDEAMRQMQGRNVRGRPSASETTTNTTEQVLKVPEGAAQRPLNGIDRDQVLPGPAVPPIQPTQEAMNAWAFAQLFAASQHAQHLQQLASQAAMMYPFMMGMAPQMLPSRPDLPPGQAQAPFLPGNGQFPMAGVQGVPQFPGLQAMQNRAENQAAYALAAFHASEQQKHLAALMACATPPQPPKNAGTEIEEIPATLNPADSAQEDQSRGTPSGDSQKGSESPNTDEDLSFGLEENPSECFSAFKRARFENGSAVNLSNASTASTDARPSNQVIRPIAAKASKAWDGLKHLHSEDRSIEEEIRARCQSRQSESTDFRPHQSYKQGLTSATNRTSMTNTTQDTNTNFTQDVRGTASEPASEVVDAAVTQSDPIETNLKFSNIDPNRATSNYNPTLIVQ